MRRVPAGALTAAGVCLLVFGATAPPSAVPDTPRDLGRPPAAAPSAVPGQGAGEVPRRFALPGRAAVPVLPVGAGADGALRPPEAADGLGWWEGGARPGAARGTVLVAGHVDDRAGNPGAFAALAGMAPGDEVRVTAADGRDHTYRITARRTYAWDGLPDDLFDASGPHRLALITCTGTYDREAGRYTRNLVLYGELVRRPG
ncbi:class F sortase [Streptomyces sp. RFCAC02]|uniref:class F sortase n=1 Tax=Streptomyces sp. RFCAC02 TaxID=2499143 RepID=UPI001020E1B1|nr:class F sortase [Streptomyces sp. RFCAC02]